MPFKILVVDEERHIRQTVRCAAEPFECEVHVVASGQQAFRRVGSEKFDGIFLAAEMARPDGFELTRRIRASALNARAVVVLVTEYHDVQSMRSGFQSGATLVVGKPINARQIRQVLNLIAGVADTEFVRFRKVSLRTPVRCRAGIRYFLTESLHLGEQGMVLQRGLRLPPEERIELEFRAPGMPAITLQARIVGQEMEDGMLVQFEDLPPGHAHRLRQLMYELESRSTGIAA